MRELTPSQKGAIAEAAIELAALELHVLVLRPGCEGGRYDLAFDFDPEIVRVQCKLAQRGKGVVRVGLQTNRCVPGGYVQTTYDRTEIDAVCAYSRELRRSFFIPAREACGRRGLHLRLAHPANNQRDGIKWADAYDFAAAIARLRAGCASGLSVSSQLH